MSFVAAFSAVSVSGEPQNILFTDLSTGSDGNIVSRRIYVSNSIGTFLVEDGVSTEYSVWALPLSDTITLDLLSADMAVKIVVEWLDINNAVLYDSTLASVGFTEYGENFLYGQTQLMTYNPLLINDNNFWANFNKVRTCIDAGNKAITRGADLYSAQQCYDLETDIIASSQYLFNANS